MFKKALGLCPFDYIRREMLHRAALILEGNHEMSIPILARFLGFDDVADLENSFNDYFLVDPGRYRELRQDTHINHGGRR